MIHSLVVVGAGPVGLLTALGATRRGCKDVVVLEQARTFEPAGHGVAIPSNGVRALRLVAPDLYEHLKQKYKASGKPFVWFDSQGNLIHKVEVANDPEPFFIIQWHQLQRELLDALPDSIQVRTDAQVVAVDHIEGVTSVKVRWESRGPRDNPFKNWASNDVSSEVEPKREGGEVEACVVVGADGIHSRVREQMYRHLGGYDWALMSSPKYTGCTLVSLVWDGVPPGADDTLNSLRAALKSNGCVGAGVESNLGLNRRLVRCLLSLIPGKSESLLNLVVRMDLHFVKASDKRPMLQEFARVVRTELDWELMVRLVEALVEWGEPDLKVRKFPMWVVPPSHEASDNPGAPEGFWRPFGVGRVFLAGDAAHGHPTTQGQGTGMGLEDACELVDLLANECQWGAQHSDSNMNAFESIEERYRDARMRRVSLTSQNSVRPLPQSDREGNRNLRKQLVNFEPRATGWEL